ncbi:putative acyl-activating enzyme 19, partial [Cucurbita argyrosperma subsp. argyrosperma]
MRPLKREGQRRLRDTATEQKRSQGCALYYEEKRARKRRKRNKGYERGGRRQAEKGRSKARVVTGSGAIHLLRVKLNTTQEGNSQNTNVEEFARMDLEGDIFSSPVMIGGRIFVGCRDDYVHCVVIVRGMAKGIIWATAEDLARNRGRVISLYRQILRSLNSPNLPLSFAARLAKKAEVRGIFLLASEERSLHNIEDLIDTAEYSLSLLRKGEIPKYIQ